MVAGWTVTRPHQNMVAKEAFSEVHVRRVHLMIFLCTHPGIFNPKSAKLLQRQAEILGHDLGSDGTRLGFETCTRNPKPEIPQSLFAVWAGPPKLLSSSLHLLLRNGFGLDRVEAPVEHASGREPTSPSCQCHLTSPLPPLASSVWGVLRLSVSLCRCLSLSLSLSLSARLTALTGRGPLSGFEHGTGPLDRVERFGFGASLGFET